MDSLMTGTGGAWPNNASVVSGSSLSSIEMKERVPWVGGSILVVHAGQDGVASWSIPEWSRHQ
jgi:hypothetical protein